MIATALAHYGVASDFGYSSESSGRDGYFCGGDERAPMPSLMTSGDNPRPISGLRETLESIWEARAFKKERTGTYAHHVHHIPRYAFLSLLLGALLTILVCQENVWRRTFDPYGNRFSLPRFMQRLDDHLVTNRPLLWSTRAHTFAYFAATFGIVLIVALLGLVGAFVEDPSELVDAMMDEVGDIAGLFLLLAVGGILSGAWAVYQRRIDLRFRKVSDNQRALLLYLLITSVLPLMAVAVMAVAFPDPSELAAFAIFFLVGSWFVTSIVYVAKHTGARDVVLSLLASVGVMAWILIVAAVVEDDELTNASVAALVLAWLILGAFLRTRRRKRVGYASRLAAATFIMLVPTAFFWGLFLITVLNPTGLSEDSIIVLSLPLIIPIFAFMTIPATRVLLKYRFWPREE